MTARQKFKMTLDCTMTALSLVLMGGNYFFANGAVHEILGIVLFVLWAVHVWLNRGFYKSLFKGRYNAFRVVQAVVNCGILLCAVLLMASGIMVSNHVFTFLGISFGAELARTVHLISSHWYFVFMSLHVGMHVGLIVRKFAGKKPASFAGFCEAKIDADCDKSKTREERTLCVRTTNAQIKKIIFHIVLALVCAYGVYAFVVRNIGKYLLFLQPFFFFDMEQGYALFFVDYICIMTAIATAGYYLGKVTKKDKQEVSK